MGGKKKTNVTSRSSTSSPPICNQHVLQSSDPPGAAQHRCPSIPLPPTKKTFKEAVKETCFPRFHGRAGQKQLKTTCRTGGVDWKLLLVASVPQFQGSQQRSPDERDGTGLAGVSCTGVRPGAAPLSHYCFHHWNALQVMSEHINT